MLKLIIHKYQKQILLALGVIILTLAYVINIFDINHYQKGPTYFPKFQKDSENLVLVSVLAKNYTKAQTEPYGLSLLRGHKNNKIIFLDGDLKEASEKLDPDDINNIRPYDSLVGIQGHIVNFFYRLGIKKISVFRWANALLTAAVLVAICYMIYKTYNGLLAGVFFVTFALSPWVTAFGSNLYWASYLWFLPLLLVFIYQYLPQNKRIKRYSLLALIGLSIFVKSLAGYEYISSIMIIAVIPIILDFFKSKAKHIKIQNVKAFIQISLVMIFGFILAFGVHASMRGNGDILTGAQIIYNHDVKRRMSVGEYHNDKIAKLNEAKNASMINTVRRYVSFNTPLLTGLINGNSFMPLVIVSFLFLVVDAMKNYQKVKLELIVWILTLLAPLSWYILAKPHSYIHTHMNYVLWYFGFIQVTLYVIVKRALLFIKNFKLERGA